MFQLFNAKHKTPRAELCTPQTGVNSGVFGTATSPGKKFQPDSGKRSPGGSGEQEHFGALSANPELSSFGFGSQFVSSVLSQETYVFFFVHSVDLPQPLLTAVDSVK